MLCRAAAAFYYGRDKVEVAYLSDAYHLLEPAVGSAAAKILFGVALLASGQNSTITGTLAGVPFSLILFVLWTCGYARRSGRRVASRSAAEPPKKRRSPAVDGVLMHLRNELVWVIPFEHVT